MNLIQIKTFLWVVKLGGFRKAAEIHHTSQPAISSRISALESSLGVELIDRSQSGIQLTKKGHDLLEYAEQLISLMNTIEEKVGNSSEYEAVLRIGVSETIVHSWLPRFLSRLRDCYPKVDVELSVDVSTNLRDALISNSLDLAFLMGPISEYSINNLELPSFPLSWYSTKEIADYLATNDAKTAFKRFPVITYARNTRPYLEIKSELTRQYGPNTRIFPSNSLSACLQMVQDGVGIGALPKLLASRLEKDGTIVELEVSWSPSALEFTASYVSNSSNWLVKSAAELAQKIATNQSE
ncbi:LysR family transcriptional regulator [Kiloniella litopenaei]|uniref:LysR family transcriptional regulator n=1 Tax=Kiloniella litopenaei TaxID=1549748 RepID=UPI003BAA4FC3